MRNGAGVGGTLNIFLINGFGPDVDDSFAFLNFGSIAGEFAVININGPGALSVSTTSGALNIIRAIETISEISAASTNAVISTVTDGTQPGGRGDQGNQAAAENQDSDDEPGADSPDVDAEQAAGGSDDPGGGGDAPTLVCK